MKILSFLRPVVAPAELARERHVRAFRAEIDAAAAAGDRTRIEALLQRPAQLGLTDEGARRSPRRQPAHGVRPPHLDPRER